MSIFQDGKPSRSNGLTPNTTIEKNTTINSRGFRGAEVAMPKPEETLRMVCLGGSACFSTGVSSDWAAWPAATQRIARRNGTKLEVMNGGVPSFTSGESIDRFKSLFLGLAPDIAMLYNEHNDVLFRRLYRRSYDPRKDVLVPIEGALDRLLSHSAIYLRVRALVTFQSKQEKVAKAVEVADEEMLEQQEELAKLTWGNAADQQARALNDEKAAVSNPYYCEKDLEDYANNLRRFIALCRANAIRPVLSTEVLAFRLDAGEAVYWAKGSSVLINYFPNYAWFRESDDAYNRTIRKVAVEEQVVLFDADLLLERQDSYFQDQVHLTDIGCAQFATLLEQRLREAGVFGTE